MDAKAKYNGVSLNDELLVGPDLLNNLSGVLLLFREERVALIADIEDSFISVRSLRKTKVPCDSYGKIWKLCMLLMSTKCLR